MITILFNLLLLIPILIVLIFIFAFIGFLAELADNDIGIATGCILAIIVIVLLFR